MGAGLEDYMNPGQGWPAAPLPAKTGSLTAEPLFRPAWGTAWPGGASVQQALLELPGNQVGTLRVQVQCPLAGASGGCQ